VVLPPAIMWVPPSPFLEPKVPHMAPPSPRSTLPKVEDVAPREVSGCRDSLEIRWWMGLLHCPCCVSVLLLHEPPSSLTGDLKIDVMERHQGGRTCQQLMSAVKSQPHQSTLELDMRAESTSTSLSTFLSGNTRIHTEGWRIQYQLAR